MFDFLKARAKAEVPALPEGTRRRRYNVSGRVQGVGFRYRAYYAARCLGLTGWVRNEDDGTVTLEVQGKEDKLAQIFVLIQQSDFIDITHISEKNCVPDPWETGFSVRGY